MDFTRRAGDVRDEFANGYFANQAFRAGISPGNSGLVPPMISRREALMEELRREQMREEMLAREIAQKRMVENEIRRELEFERRMAMRRIEEERFLPMEMEPRIGYGERLGNHGFMPSPESGVGFGERLGHHGYRPSPVMPQFEDIRIDERPIGRYREVEAFERPPINPRLKAEFSGYMDDEIAPPPVMPHFNDIRVDEGRMDHHGEVTAYERPSIWPKSFDGEEGLVKPRLKDEFSGYKNKKPSKHQVLSGAKRKRATELSQPPPSKKWRCPLCQVTATSQKNLNVHLHGKKHQAKQAELDLKANPKNSNAAKHQAMSSSSKKSAKNDKEEERQLGGKWPNYVWCKLCNLKCNSSAMLECHLKGKKHKAQLKGKEVTVSKGKGKCEDRGWEW